MKSKNKGSVLSTKTRSRTLPLLALCLPLILYMFVFNYLPMFGIVIAFKDYTPMKGILGSEWVGFKNFDYFFKTSAGSIIGKTIAYNLGFLFLGIFLGVLVALLMFELDSKKSVAYFQTAMSLPRTISYVIIAYIVYALLSYDNGVVNHIIKFFGGEPILWYNEPKYWPFILTVTSCWKGVGVGSILYYATLTGIDSGLYEAAALDGANRLQQTRYVSIPHLLPIISIMLITGVAGALGGDQGLFYQVPKDSSMLYPTTDVLSTYVQRGVLDGNFAITAAVGLFQNIVGLILLLTTNGIIKKISPENSML